MINVKPLVQLVATITINRIDISPTPESIFLFEATKAAVVRYILGFKHSTRRTFHMSGSVDDMASRLSTVVTDPRSVEHDISPDNGALALMAAVNGNEWLQNGLLDHYFDHNDTSILSCIDNAAEEYARWLSHEIAVEIADIALASVRTHVEEVEP